MSTYRVTEEDGSVYDITEEDGPSSDPLGSVEDTAPGLRAGRSMLGGLSKTIPFGDEIIAGGAALSEQLPGFLGGTGRGLGEAYDSRLGEVRGYQQGFEEAAGDSGANLATEVGGSLLAPLGPTSKLFTKAPGVVAAGRNVVASGVVGAGLAGIHGFGEGEGLADRLEKGVSSAKSGAIAGTLLGGAGESLIGAANRLPAKLESIGLGMQRFGLGASKADYNKGLGGMTPWDFKAAPESSEFGAELASKTKSYLNQIIDSGELPKKWTPKELNKVASEKVIGLTSTKEGLLKSFDEAGGKITPNFDKTRELIEEGQLSDDIEGALQRVDKLEETIANKGAGKSFFVEGQKKLLGDKWKTGNRLDQALYHDLKNSLSKTIPGLEGLNKSLQKWQLVSPILKKGLAAEESFNPLVELEASMGTTGKNKLIAPAMLGHLAAGNMGMVAGLTLGAGARAGATKTGSKMVGSLLRKTGGKILAGREAITPILSKLSSGDRGKDYQKIAQGIGIGSLLKSAKNMPDVLPETNFKADLKSSASASELPKPTKASLTLDKIAHVMQKFESNYNPKAVSRAGAIGLMQVMPGTGKMMAKELGLEYQPHNPKQNVLLGKAYMLKMLTQFKDLPLALASYNSGPEKVNQWIKEYGPSWDSITKGINKDIAAGRKNVKYFIETRRYVPKIMDELKKGEA